MTAPFKDDPARTDEKYMARCLELARQAADAGEVPVGAVVVLGDRIVGEGRNRTRERRNALAHAEMLALHEAFDTVGDGRMPEAELFCSLEPCFMCTGALLHARIRRVVFGAADPKFGACGSLADLPRDPRLNHRCPVRGGVAAEESARMLREFFQRLR